MPIVCTENSTSKNPRINRVFMAVVCCSFDDAKIWVFFGILQYKVLNFFTGVRALPERL